MFCDKKGSASKHVKHPHCDDVLLVEPPNINVDLAGGVDCGEVVGVAGPAHVPGTGALAGLPSFVSPDLDIERPQSRHHVQAALCGSDFAGQHGRVVFAGELLVAPPARIGGLDQVGNHKLTGVCLLGSENGVQKRLGASLGSKSALMVC